MSAHCLLVNNGTWTSSSYVFNEIFCPSILWLQHNDTMGDYWGRFGGGAPKARNDFKKKNLVDIIHTPREKVCYACFSQGQTWERKMLAKIYTIMHSAMMKFLIACFKFAAISLSRIRIWDVLTQMKCHDSIVIEFINTLNIWNFIRRNWSKQQIVSLKFWNNDTA